MKSARILIASAAVLGLMAIPAWADTTPTDAQKQAPATTTAAKPAHHAKAAAHTMAPRLDLNSASREELSKLPGLDEATADKIIAARPFKSRGELLSKNLVPSTEYRKLREKVMVKPATTAAAQ